MIPCVRKRKRKRRWLIFPLSSVVYNRLVYFCSHRKSALPRGDFHQHRPVLALLLGSGIGDGDDVLVVQSVGGLCVGLQAQGQVWAGIRGRRLRREGVREWRRDMWLHTGHRRVIALQKAVADLRVFLRRHKRML